MFFTDPVRTPEPEVTASRLPSGSAIVYRTYGAPDAEARARRLLAIARSRGLKLLIGQDVGLARRVGADGVHLPERLAHRAAPLIGADAVVISVALPSRSPSAGPALGPVRLAARVRATGRVAYALGGINNKTARRLLGAGLIGLAAVEGFGA